MSELPRGWVEAHLGQLSASEANAITDGPYGSNLKSSHYSADGARVIRLGNIGARVFIDHDAAFVPMAHFEQLTKHRVFAGDIVVAALGEPIGRACILPEEIGLSIVKADCFRFRVAPEVSSTYVMLWLNSDDARERFLSRSHGLGRVRINLSDFRGTIMPLAPLPEQRRIVAKIDSLSGKSRRARDHLDHIPRLVEKYKQAVLAAAFREMDVTGSMATIGDVTTTITSGSRDWTKFYDRGDAVFVLAGNVRPLAFDPTPKRLIDPPLNGPDAKRSRIRKDDLLITIVGAGTGDICRVPEDFSNYFVCQSVGLMRLMVPETARFLELYFNCEAHGGGQIARAIYGQGRPHLSFDDLRLLTVPNPNLTVVRQIVHRIETAFTWIDRLAAEATSARKLVDRLDQAILAKAFRGELVPQDPADEPASVLLERIRAESGAAPKAKRGRKAKTA